MLTVKLIPIGGETYMTQRNLSETLSFRSEDFVRKEKFDLESELQQDLEHVRELRNRTRRPWNFAMQAIPTPQGPNKAFATSGVLSRWEQYAVMDR